MILSYKKKIMELTWWLKLLTTTEATGELSPIVKINSSTGRA
jgi:hypothetical protein